MKIFFHICRFFFNPFISLSSDVNLSFGSGDLKLIFLPLSSLLFLTFSILVIFFFFLSFFKTVRALARARVRVCVCARAHYASNICDDIYVWATDDPRIVLDFSKLGQQVTVRL